MAKIYIRHRLYEGLTWGQNGEIKFGVKGGQAPFIALVDEDDPLVHVLLEDPDVTVVVPEGQRDTVFICSDHPDREFATKSALTAHMRAKGHNGAPEDKPEE